MESFAIWSDVGTGYLPASYGNGSTRLALEILLYLDDIVVVDPDLPMLMLRLEQVLQRLQPAD